MSYVDAFYDQAKDVVTVVERTDGERVIKEIQPVHNFYYADPNGKHKSIYGDPVTEVRCASLKDFKKNIGINNNNQLFESDLRPLNKVLAQEYVNAEPPKLNVCFLDIEVDFDPQRGYSSPDDPFTPITAIGVYLQWMDAMVCLAVPPKTLTWEQAQEVVKPLPEVMLFRTEKEMLDVKRYSGKRDLEQPLGASHMGLIYVNPQGPDANPDPLLAAHDIRETFGRMAMNDYETAALVAGGHTFGKSHGAAPESHKGPDPEASRIQDQATGWNSNYKSGKGVDAISSGIEGAWTQNPIKWDMGYLDCLYGHEWELTKSPAGAHQWTPKKNGQEIKMVPDAHNKNVFHPPMMQTTDISLKVDPSYGPITRHFHENPEEFHDAFARAWFKLTHRDMGPRACYLGSDVPKEELIWQDPIDKPKYKLKSKDIDILKSKILKTGISVSELVSTAWASASTFRGSDKRGGANGARIMLEPQKNWKVNNPAKLAKVISALKKIKKQFDGKSKSVSMADLIVLAGGVGIELAAKKAGYKVKVPFSPGRGDARQDQTDIHSFGLLEPQADGFRNYSNGGESNVSTEEKLVDKAQLMGLTAPEMTVLIGGMRVLDTNFDKSKNGVFTKKPGVLTNDYFKNLLDMNVTWKETDKSEQTFVGSDRKTKKAKWRGTRVDLIFGSNSQLRALAEVYACDDSQDKFIKDFISAWVKVMNADRFDLKLN